MTFKEMKDLLEKNNIPDDAQMLSNSGWECGATSVEACYYSSSKNEIHLVQEILNPNIEYDEDTLKSGDEKSSDWILLK